MMHFFCIVKRRWRSRTLVSVFLLDVLFLFWISSFASGDVVGSDKSVLLKFKSSVSDPYGILSGWNSEGGDHCSWFGVACDRKSRVLALNVTGGGGSRTGGNNSEVFSCSKLAEFPFYGFGIKRNCSVSDLMLAGTLSSVIGKLTELRVLSLPFNGFTGEIPVEIWNLPKLEVLDLEGNSLTGTLPLEFTGLRRLRVLNLGFNQISGGIPSSLSNCVGLQILNLAGNQLSGTIPGFVDTLSELKGLYLSFNRLHGSVPYELGNNCKNLEHLDLSGNSLHGEIPRGLGNCSHLLSLLLFSNMLEGVVPPEFGRLRKLEVLDLSRNNLTGLIPAELGDCGELSVLVLSIKYDLPLTRKNSGVNSSFEPFNAAYNSQNKFQGNIPVKIFTLPKLRILWAPRANLQGKFPSDWGPCDSLEMVNLAQNFFMGEIPEVFGRCKHLHFLDLSSNNLTGELSSEIPVPCMTVFDISGNHLSGIIPRFSSAVCPHISPLDVHLLQPNDPSSAYTTFFMHKTQTLILFPFSKASGGFVILHNFGSNNFSGPFPLLPVAPERLNKETTYAFLVGGNNFNGSFFGNLFTVCGKLKGLIVNVSSNNLSEGIPADVGAMCRSLVLLDASRNLITGSLPVGFGDLDSLSCLDLGWNTLQGQVPVSLGRLKGLKYLSLAGNNLTGFIPSSLGQLDSLQLLDLSLNFLSGEIPKELVSLRNLDVLLLNNNNLSGHIPSNFANLTSLSILNVSFNNLSGHIPGNNSLMGCSSVLGNPSLQSCFFSLSMNSVPSSGSKTRTSGNNGFNPIEIASIASATAIFSILLALIVLFFYTRKCAPKSRARASGRREFRVFTNTGLNLTFDNVVRATRSFNPSNCIGNGGFGATYKAELSPGVLVAVKRLSIGRCQGIQQFHAEIKTLGRIRHQNLVTLLGYHASETEMFLIYNYLPGGNLEKFIQERAARVVDWRILHKIALDIARVLAYLHEQCVPRVLHRDVKPSNILLDDDYNAYLSDFGLARLLGISETHATTGVAGTFGYVAPEYALTCRVSDKADVYSYGVVLLELFSDKKALDPSFSPYGNGFNIVDWACMLIRQGRAKEFFSAGLWDAGPQDNLVKTLHLGIMCTANSLSNRPKMKQVVGRLRHIQPTPAPGTAS